MRQYEWFSSLEFQNEFEYEGPLGAFCGDAGSRIYLWAPTAESVYLQLYPTGNDSDAMDTIAMEKGDKGVWRYETTHNLNGVYYDFDGETIKKWLKTFYRRFFTQQFKRNCVPDGASVGSVGLSPRSTWRMPSDASGRIWLDEIEKL